jgi:hypothetical protein
MAPAHTDRVRDLRNRRSSRAGIELEDGLDLG